MTHKFEYRHDDMGDDWEAFKGNACDTESVATDVAEEYWGHEGDANDFNLIVEVRPVDAPHNVDTFKVTADYSVNFYADLQNEETK